MIQDAACLHEVDFSTIDSRETLLLGLEQLLVSILCHMLRLTFNSWSDGMRRSGE